MAFYPRLKSLIILLIWRFYLLILQLLWLSNLGCIKHVTEVNAKLAKIIELNLTSL